jgi:hypothetical protein
VTAAAVSLPGGGGCPSAAAGEPSLKLKLKVSKPHSNSSKCLVAGGGQAPVKSTSAALETTNEPKVPKIKIKLKDKIVKLEENSSGGGGMPGSVLPSTASSLQLSTGASPEAADSLSAPSPVHFDLKTKVKIRPLPGELGTGGGLQPKKDHEHHHPSGTTNSLGSSSSSSGVSGHYRNLTLGHTGIVVDADRKLNRKSCLAATGGLTKEKKVKDRLAIWTESLAKHGQREEGAVATNSSSGNTSKATLPRLFVGSSLPVSSSPSVSLSPVVFSKTDGLSEKGEKQNSFDKKIRICQIPVSIRG